MKEPIIAKMTRQEVLELVRRVETVAISGPPKSGKTTLANWLTDNSMHKVIHGDNYVQYEWSEQSLKFADDINNEDWPFGVICEGCVVPRALRKGMNIDLLIILTKLHEPLAGKALGLGKQVMNMLGEWINSNETVPVYLIEVID